MPDFRIHLDKNIVIKLLMELVPFETSGHKTQEDYDEWIKKGIKKWSNMSQNTLLGKIFNKDYKDNDIDKFEIDRTTNKYFIIPNNYFRELDETDSLSSSMEESSLFDESPKNIFPNSTYLFSDQTEQLINDSVSNLFDNSPKNSNMSIIKEYDDIFNYSSSESETDSTMWNSLCDDLECSLTIDSFINNILE